MKFPWTASFFSITQLFVLSTLLWYLPSLAQIHPTTILFWITTAFTCIWYYTASIKDPGYILKTSNNPTNLKNTQNLQLMNELVVKSEVHFCKICSVNQPIRTKHCYSCQKCVQIFDHHCPLLQNCVGRYNRPYFYSFLLFQSVQLVLIQILILDGFRIKINYYMLVLGVFVFSMLIIMGGLLILHSAFMILGVTTWEYLSHNDIWYLKDKQKWRIFSDGFFKNMRNYWITSSQVKISANSANIPA